MGAVRSRRPPTKNLEQRVQEAILEHNLSELRISLGFSQEEIAARIQMDRPNLSKLEKRDDHLVSTLRRYVEALGGRLLLVAEFDDGKEVKLRGV